MKNAEQKFSVGALLYTPALNQNIAGAVLQGRLGERYSLALCLEDTISAGLTEAAEGQAVNTLRQLWAAAQDQPLTLPKLFIRVKEPAQAGRLFAAAADCQSILTGFIFPKYTVANAAAYNQALEAVNQQAERPLAMMPILESPDIVDLPGRPERLAAIKERIDAMGELVLNVRVGGNDFCNQFSTRRHYDETIYDILPVAQLLGDILAVFSRDYVVSGPVWEFFSSQDGQWAQGLRRELKLDRLNGFVGKTVIHPKQIPVVNEMLKVTNKDLQDAKAILNWDGGGLLVGKSYGGERMNEVRTNCNWARKTLLLAELYGIESAYETTV